MLRLDLIRLAVERPDTRIHLVPLLREAGWAGGSFGGSLSGPVHERPGEGSRAVKRGETLHGWDEYCRLVAETYETAPHKSSGGVKAFTAFKEHVLKMFLRIQSRVTVEFVDYDPYASAEEMDEQVRETGVLRISRQFNQSDAFGPEINLMLRAVHDFAAHMGAAPGRRAPRSFGFKGEMQAYNKHLNLIGCRSKAAGAMFTEIVAQVCRYIHFGNFPTQKIITLPEFDWCRLGLVQGHRIVDDDLVPV